MGLLNEVDELCRLTRAQLNGAELAEEQTNAFDDFCLRRNGEEFVDPATEKELQTLNRIVQPYISPNEDVTMKEDKVDFSPETIVYDYYTDSMNYCTISESSACERLTNYHHHDENPLIFRDIDKHYYFAGPDPDTNPIKRKFYNCMPTYENYYNGKYGQTVEIGLLKETDISAEIWQHLVLDMAMSGDFTLQQALYTVIHACDRCRHVLLYRYKNYFDSHEGYPETDTRFWSSNDHCQYCKKFMNKPTPLKISEPRTLKY